MSFQEVVHPRPDFAFALARGAADLRGLCQLRARARRGPVSRAVRSQQDHLIPVTRPVALNPAATTHKDGVTRLQLDELKDAVAEWGRLRFGADLPGDQRLAELEGTLRLIGLDPTEHAPLLAPLVDIPLPPGRAAI